MKTNIISKRLFSLALPCVCWVLVASTTGCGDDDDGAGATAGSGGASAGKGSGGSATAGKASGGSETGGKASGGKGGTRAAGANNPIGGEGGAPPVVTGGEGGGSTEGGSGGEGVTAALPLIFNVSPTGHDRFFGTTFDAAGNLYAVGQITTSNDTTADVATLVAKFTPDGKPDLSFASGGFYVRNVANGTTGELFRSIVVQSTGKIVVAGTIEHVALGADPRDRDAALMRINPDGTKDTGFGKDGILVLDLSTGVVNPKGLTKDKNTYEDKYSTDSGWGLARYADDRLLMSGGMVRKDGLDTDFVILRLSADGVRDQNFGTNGQVAVDTKAHVVNAEPVIDEEISNNASPRNLTLLPGTDGIIGAGYQPKPGGDTSPIVYKVTDGGVLDDSFGDHGVFHAGPLTEQTEAYAAVVQPISEGGYKLVTTGYGRQLSTEPTDLVSLRLSSDGKLDETYGEDGLVRIDIGGFDDNSRNLLVLPDRRVVLAGGGRLTSANADGIVTVLTPDGAPDTDVGPNGWKRFDLGGPADFLWGVALSPDQQTLAFVGLKGAGSAPVPASAADDAAVLWLPLP